MIVRIEKELFNSTDPEILSSLSGIIRTALTKRIFWDIDSIPEPDELIATNWYCSYLSIVEQKELVDMLNIIYKQGIYNSDELKYYLTTIIIGQESGQMSPIIASKLLNSNSMILLENEDNDWNFVKSIIEKYKNGSLNKQKGNPNRKHIYGLIFKYLENKWIEPIHAGGGGEFEKRIDNVFKFKGKEFAFKILTIFDSDKTTLNEKLKKETINRIKYLKSISVESECDNIEFNAETDIITWHMLYKREIENYLPLQIIENYKLDRDIKNYYKKTDLELDFIDLENTLPISGDVKRYFKREFPKLFLSDECTKLLLDDKCKHHKVQIEIPNNKLEEVSEMEQILIKIAKII